MKRLILILFFSSILIKGNAQMSISPNPFTTQTSISYTLASTNTVTIYVYNLNGQHVQTLMSDSLINAGAYSFDYTALGLPTGVYLFSLTSGDSAYNQKAIYMGGATALGIDQINNNSTLLIYPNPAKNLISINYTGFKKIDILDLNGRTIKTVSTSDKSISISDINRGEYIINIYSENKLIATQKFFKD
jgi:hypothetical protein